MNRKNSQNAMIKMVISALLCAIGIVIPLFAPKIILEPASYTLASHVPIFLAMFISPAVAATVALGTTLGFFLAGFPLVVVLRALSHIVFVLVGAFLLQKKPELLRTFGGTAFFALLTGVVHAVSELLVVTAFYMGSSMSAAYYQNGYFLSVFLLVGVGGLIHSLVDFSIAVAVWRPVSRVVGIPVSVKEVLRRPQKGTA